MHFALVLTAAGSSTRFGIKKEYLPLNENTTQTVLESSLITFLNSGIFSVCVITILPGSDNETKKAISSALELSEKKQIPIYFIEGGNTRQESVYKGLLFLESVQSQKSLQNLPVSGITDYTGVMIHDGARPWVSEKVIIETAKITEIHGAACPAVETVDTTKQVNSSGRIISHLKRESIYAVQTPQSFLFSKILEAHKKAKNDGIQYTDDTEIWGTYVGDVYICLGDYANKKITFKSDLSTEDKT